MISLISVATLNLLKASHEQRHAHLSAASGLVQVGELLYVIADDENHLAVFSTAPGFKGELIELFPGDLPLPLEERKAAKADLEVLTQIPPSKRYPQGALLALGSGSKEARRRGVILAFDAQNAFSNIEVIDLNSLYDEIKDKIGKLNIEGAVIVEKDIILFQRGNKKNKLNASIRIPLKDFYSSVLDSDKKINLDMNVTPYDLGEIAGVPLCFTDAAALPDGSIIFTAAAENTSDSYLDGMCMGSIIGLIDAAGNLHSTHALDKIVKAEGIEATLSNGKIHLLLVTDADDATAPAQLYTAELDGYPF